MISKNQLKLIRQLGQKKYRKQLNQYLVQGEKNVLELLNSPLKVTDVFATQNFIDNNQSAYPQTHFITADEEQLTKVSTLVSNNAAIAIVDMPSTTLPDENSLILALDGVSDPGNLGTIIRVADWYGIKHIVASTDSADPYNPKTISATMGSFVRGCAYLWCIFRGRECPSLPVCWERGVINGQRVTWYTSAVCRAGNK